MSNTTLSIESLLISDLHGEKYMHIFHHHTINRGFFSFLKHYILK